MSESKPAPWIEILPDGTEILYLDGEGNPSPPDQAVMVKVIYPDGSIAFGFPT